MKRTPLFLIPVLLLFCLFGLPGPGAGQPLKIGTGEWAPYTSSQMEDRGAASAIVERVFAEMAVEIEFVFYPWSRCYDTVKHGMIWGAFPFAYTEERAEEVDFSEPILPSTTKFFYYAKGPKPFRFDTLRELKAWRIGGMRGYYYESIFKKNGIRLDYVEKLENGLEKLMMGRTDLFVANELVGWYTIGRKFHAEREHFRTLQQPLSRHGVRMIVSREYPESDALLRRFNAALMAVKSEIFYNTLLQKLKIGPKDVSPAQGQPSPH